MLNKTIRGRVASVLAVAAMLLSGGAANAQDLSQIKKPGDPGDYPVHVGKRVRWASEVAKERQQAARAAQAATQVNPNALVPVQVGKRTVAVRAGSVTPETREMIAKRTDGTSVAASSEKPEEARASGYFEKRGRAIFWVPLPK